MLVSHPLSRTPAHSARPYTHTPIRPHLSSYTHAHITAPYVTNVTHCNTFSTRSSSPARRHSLRSSIFDPRSSISAPSAQHRSTSSSPTAAGGFVPIKPTDSCSGCPWWTPIASFGFAHAHFFDETKPPPPRPYSHTPVRPYRTLVPSAQHPTWSLEIGHSLIIGHWTLVTPPHAVLLPLPRLPHRREVLARTPDRYSNLPHERLLMAQSTPPPGNVATAADYADAMLTARRARTVFGYALVLILLLQLVLFVMVHFTSKLNNAVTPDSLATTVQPPPGPPTTSPAAGVEAAPARSWARQILKYIVGLSTYFGLIFAALLGLILLLLLNVMLIGRLIGVSHVTGAFIWALVVLLMVFPWQAILNNQDLTAETFKVPGVLYTWNELTLHGHFANTGDGMFVNWVRFVVAPVVTIILVFTVLMKSGYGLRMALGEETERPKKKFEDEEEMEGDRNVIR